MMAHRLWLWHLIAVAMLQMDGGRAFVGICPTQHTSRILSRHPNVAMATTSADKDVELEVEVKGAVKNINQAEWDSLLSPDESPFMEYDWIYCMEESGCATEETGWRPLHFLVREARNSGDGGDDDAAAAPADTAAAKAAKTTTAVAPPGRLLAAVPMYLKGHSMGEFIFDQQFAEASLHWGVRYYPKLLVGVPFTPAAGSRVLIDPTLDDAYKHRIRVAVAVFLANTAANSGVSSVHVNFCSDAEVRAFTEAGFAHRKSLQYHWRNEDRGGGSAGAGGGGSGDDSDGGIDGASRLQGGRAKYRDFDGYLNNFASKRRIKIKRERRSVYVDSGVRLAVYAGDDIPNDMFEDMFRIYKTTIDKLYYGRQYLNLRFFRMLRTRFRRNLCFIIAEQDGDGVGGGGLRGRVGGLLGGGGGGGGGAKRSRGRAIAGTFNIVKAGRFYGRYWGAFEYVKNLHFETCYYKAIEHCIEQGIQVMEPGAGGGDFKFLRGFEPATVNSVHLCTNPSFQSAVARFLQEEAGLIDEATEEMVARSPLAGDRRGAGGGGGSGGVCGGSGGGAASAAAADSGAAVAAADSGASLATGTTAAETAAAATMGEAAAAAATGEAAAAAAGGEAGSDTVRIPH